MKTSFIVLATGLLLNSTLTLAVESPDRAAEECLGEARAMLHLDAQDVAIRSSSSYGLSGQRTMVMVQTEMTLNRARLTPRLYCIVEADGLVQRLEFQPRLPQPHDQAVSLR